MTAIEFFKRKTSNKTYRYIICVRAKQKKETDIFTLYDFIISHTT